MSKRLPPAAVILGIAGLVPFVALGIAAQSNIVEADSQRFLLGLLAYGAVILAFLGGVHWGFVLHPGALPEGMTEAERRDATRLGLGVLPSLIGWAAMMTPVLGVPEVGLAVLILGFIAVVATEARKSGRAYMPNGYMALRWILSIVVLIVLVSVLGLRLIGAKILL